MALKSWAKRHGQRGFEMQNGALIVVAGEVLVTVTLYRGDELIAMGLRPVEIGQPFNRRGAFRDLREEIARKEALIFAGVEDQPPGFKEFMSFTIRDIARKIDA